MHPQPLFCPDAACPSRGVVDGGNLRVHDSLCNRWRCRTCRKTFSARQGTPFLGLKTDPALVVLILILLMYGCPLQAIVAAYGFDERTVASWQQKAGQHCEQVHQALVTTASMDLGQGRADEVRVRLQRRCVLWMAMAICVPTRLCPSGYARWTPGWEASRARTVTNICRFFGDTAPIARLLPAEQIRNTAYIERLNAAFRQRLCGLTRKGRALLRKPRTLTTRLYLLGCVYNWCPPHQSLSAQEPCTPAMAAGLTSHVWSVSELLCFRIAPAPFVPRKKRGRKPKHDKLLVTA